MSKTILKDGMNRQEKKRLTFDLGLHKILIKHNDNQKTILKWWVDASYVVHYVCVYGLFAKYTPFKCHKCIGKSLIWQKNLWIKIINLNKNIY